MKFRSIFAPKRFIRERAWLNWLVITLWTLLVSYIFTFAVYYIQYAGRVNAWEWQITHGPSFLLSYFFVLLLYMVLECTGFLWIPTLGVGLLTIVSSTINYFKLDMRSEPFFPWDLSLTKELTTIMPQLEIQLTRQMIISILIFVFLLLVSIFIPMPRFNGKANKLKNCIVYSVSFLILSCACYGFVKETFFNEQYTNKLEIYSNQWEQEEGYKENGFITAFLMNINFLKVEKPASYSARKIDKLTQEIVDEAEKITVTEYQRPNIILIMSEGFWDVTELEKITYEVEPLPTLKHIQDNFMSGTILTSKFGGGTSNVEFEALTGFADTFLPSGSTPYQQFVLKPFFSAAGYLADHDYNTIALHPYQPEFWNRSKSYPFMGFQEFVSQDDFDDPEMERGFISDMEVTKKIIEIYEENEKNSQNPLFNFTVTVQNHMPYWDGNYSEEEIVAFTAEDVSEPVLNHLRDLATGLNHSDLALQVLIDYFSEVEEPVIIAFFGDHTNKLGETSDQVFLENGLISEDSSTAEYVDVVYKTPFVIWNNFQEEKIDLGRISAYQIMPTIMEEFYMDMPLYFSFLNQSKEVSRGFSLGCAVNPDSSITAEKTETQAALYEDMRLIQYDYMFGEQYGKETLFETSQSALVK